MIVDRQDIGRVRLIPKSAPPHVCEECAPVCFACFGHPRDHICEQPKSSANEKEKDMNESAIEEREVAYERGFRDATNLATEVLSGAADAGEDDCIHFQVERQAGGVWQCVKCRWKFVPLDPTDVL